MRLGFDVSSLPHRSQSAKVFVRLEGVVFVDGFFEFEADVGEGVDNEVIAIIADSSPNMWLAHSKTPLYLGRAGPRIHFALPTIHHEEHYLRADRRRQPTYTI